MTRLVTFAIVLYALLGPSSARAFRTAADDAGVTLPMSRPSATVQLVLYRADSAGPSNEVVLAALEEAALAWSESACVSIEPMLLGVSSTPPSQFDGLSTVVVVSSGWTALGYAPSQAAVAELRNVELPASLQIVDADLYLNADTIDWASPEAPDLRAVLTHEFGHVLFGLAHPCSADGLSAPLCTADDRATSIMHPEYAPGAWVPLADDVAGACALSVVDACAGVSCDSSEQCVDGECLSAPSCVDGTVCVDGACAVAGPGAGMCTSRDGLGVACVSGADCASRRCLTVPRAMQSYCTRACGADSECGPEERCRLVDGAYVCGPPPPSGCAVTPWSPAAGWRALLFAALSLYCYRRRSQ